MAIVTVKTQLTFEDNAGTRHVYPWSRTITGLTSFEPPQIIAIAADASKVPIYNAEDVTEQVDPWTFLLLHSTGDLDVELTCNSDDNDRLERFTLRLVKGIPLIRGSNVSYDNHHADSAFEGSAVDVIDKIVVDNPAATAQTLTMALGK